MKKSNKLYSKYFYQYIYICKSLHNNSNKKESKIKLRKKMFFLYINYLSNKEIKFLKSFDIIT